MFVWENCSMTTGGGSGGVEPWQVWSVGVLSAFGDVSPVAWTGGGSVWVEAWGCDCLSMGDASSIVCTESVIVLASTVASLW